MPSWYEYRTSTIEERREAFEENLLEGGYGDEIARWPAYVNADILACYQWAKTDWIDRDRYIERYRYQHRRRFQHGGMSNGLPGWTVHRDAGNNLFWALKLGIVVEEIRDGVRGWRLLNEKPIWDLDKSRRGARLIRLQGGDEAEQAERARRARLDATRERLRATLAKKACAKATFAIGHTLALILRDEPEFRIPEGWCEAGFVPGALAGAYLSACSPTIREACVTGEFSKQKLADWKQELDIARSDVHCEAFERRREAMKVAQREDDQALAGLAGLGDL